MCCLKPDQAQSNCLVTLDYNFKKSSKINVTASCFSYELCLHGEKKSVETGVLLKIDLVTHFPLAT